MIRPWLLELLRCTKCGAKVVLRGGEGSSVVQEGSLECSRGHNFPVRNGIPRFAGESYAQSFGFQWNRFARTQLDSASGTTESLEAFRIKTGFSPEDLKGKRVLDVGCGMGRFLEIAADWGAEVVGVDLSAAVDAAYRNLESRRNVTILQADVFQLPFAEESFDLVYSIGVLHHTPDTRQAFLALPRLVKKGGQIAVWIYPRGWYLLTSRFYRLLTTRLSKGLLLRICRIAGPLGALERRGKAGAVLRWVLPVSGHPDPRWRILDTFDWYSPRYQWRHSDEEVESWFREAGLEDIRHGSFPVSMRGIRP